MSDWATVHWSRARQITDLIGIKGAGAPASGISPASYYADLLANARQGDAVTFLALALPRYEVIRWTTDVMARFGNADRDLDDMRAFEVARQWVRSPSEALRRQCQDLAETMEDMTPEKILLLAIFFSGGSIAPDGQTPVHPKEDVTGHLAGAAIAMTVARASDRGAVYAEVLSSGESLARRAEA